MTTVPAVAGLGATELLIILVGLAVVVGGVVALLVYLVVSQRRPRGPDGRTPPQPPPSRTP